MLVTICAYYAPPPLFYLFVRLIITKKDTYSHSLPLTLPDHVSGRGPASFQLLLKCFLCSGLVLQELFQRTGKIVSKQFEI